MLIISSADYCRDGKKPSADPKELPDPDMAGSFVKSHGWTPATEDAGMAVTEIWPGVGVPGTSSAVPV
jgi:hypothetical protein